MPAVFLLPLPLIALLPVVQLVPEWLKERYPWYMVGFNASNWMLDLFAAMRNPPDPAQHHSAERNEVGLRRRRHVGRALITAVVRQLSDEQFWHWTARHVGHHRSSSLTVPYADFGTKERKRRELSTRMA